MGYTDMLAETYETIAGVPQTVHKLPLNDISVIRHVIIGPCEHPDAVKNAIESALRKCGVSVAEAARMVTLSGIPSRQTSRA